MRLGGRRGQDRPRRLLGRELINTQPNADGRKFDKGKIIGRAPVVAGGDTTTLLDLVMAADSYLLSS